MPLPDRHKTKEEREKFLKSKTIGYREDGVPILSDCTYEELLEGVGGYSPEELERWLFDSWEENLKKYHEVHIPPFTIYRAPHGKYGLLNAKGYPCGKAKYSYCSKAGFEDYLQDEKGCLYEFDPEEGLIPVSKEDKHKILNS